MATVFSLAILLFVFFFRAKKATCACSSYGDHRHHMGKSSAMRRVIKMSTTRIYYTHARALKRFKKNRDDEKGVVVVQQRT
jgi:hypothetical protein|tara:strand:- start:8651 stop:8893 length:243 start_codon:yes stop_codon:yes gene_type:complete